MSLSQKASFISKWPSLPGLMIFVASKVLMARVFACQLQCHGPAAEGEGDKEAA